MPSYWWAGPGYGDYSDGLANFISPDRYIDITAFGTFFPGETQYALNRYNEMVAQNFSAAQQAASLEATRQLIEDLLNDSDPTNDDQAAQLLASNPNLGLQINGENFFGRDAAGLIVSQDGVLDVGLLGTVTVDAGGLNASWDFQPFALYDDGYGNTYNVLMDPNTGAYEPFDQNNLTDRQRAAVSYAQKAAAERAAGRTQQAEHFERLSRFFQVTPEERTGLRMGDRISKWFGTYMSAPTENENKLAALLQRRAFTLAIWNGATIDNPNTLSLSAAGYYTQYRTAATSDTSRRTNSWMLDRPGETLVMGQNGLNNATAIAGFISFFNTVLNTLAIANRTSQLAQMDREINLARRLVVEESTWVVPPRPSEISTFMAPLRDRLSPAEYNRYLSEISNESAAFWGSNP
jgi:hypothetical protein